MALAVSYGSNLCAAGPDSAASSLFGYVTDSSGVDGIRGAVVSVEWLVTPSSKTTSRTTPAVLAVWQTRTDKDGAFRLPASIEALRLPAGAKVTPSVFPRLQVFAVGHETFRTADLGKLVSIAKTGRVSIKWPNSPTMIRLVRLRESPDSMATQIEDWIDDLKRGTTQDAWPQDKQQRLASYRPLMEAVSEACYVYQLDFASASPACERAKRDFALQEPAPQWVEIAPPTTPSASAEAPSPPITIITPSETPASGIQGSRPVAPTEKVAPRP